MVLRNLWSSKQQNRLWPSGYIDGLSTSNEDSTNSCTTPTENQFRPDHASSPTRSSQQNKWRDRPLRILTINFQSAYSKRSEIPYLLETMKPDVVSYQIWSGSVKRFRNYLELKSSRLKFCPPDDFLQNDHLGPKRIKSIKFLGF